MSFLGLDTQSAIEPQPVPDGEYTVRINSAGYAPSKKGVPQVTLVMGVQGVVGAKLVTDYIQMPTDADTPDVRNRKLLRLKHLQECFNVARIDDVKELEGLEGTVVLRTEVSEEYGDQNKVARYVKA